MFPMPRSLLFKLLMVNNGLKIKGVAGSGAIATTCFASQGLQPCANPNSLSGSGYDIIVATPDRGVWHRPLHLPILRYRNGCCALEFVVLRQRLQRPRRVVSGHSSGIARKLRVR